MYSIKLKDGHQYIFDKYRKIRTKFQNGVEILVLEIQRKPRSRYKTVRLLPKTIRTTTLSELKEMMIGIE